MEKSTVQKVYQDLELKSNTDSRDLETKPKKDRENINKIEFILFEKSPMLISILQVICIFTMMTFLIFYILFWRNEIKVVIAAPVSFIIGIVSTLAYTFSLAFRCVSVLSVTIVTSSQGRMILLSLITGILVGGPLISIMHNTNEASVTISCTADLAQEYMTNMSAAYREAYNDMTDALIGNVKTWEKISGGVQTVLNPIRNSLESVEEKFKEAKNSVEEAAGKCNQGITQAYTNCGQGANDAYNDCRRKVPDFNPKEVPGEVKDFFKDVGAIFKGRKRRATGNINDICEVLSIGNKVCEPLKQINVCKVLEAPESIVSNVLLSGTNLFNSFAELFNFKLSIDKTSSGQVNSSINHTKINQLIRDEFEEKYDVVLYIVHLAQIILILPIIVIPISAALYLRKYLKFRNKVESKHLSTFMKKQKKSDRTHRNLQLVQLLTHFLFSLTIICFDHSLFWIENVVNKHGAAIFSAEGVVKLAFSSQGGPILKPIIDEFVETFTITKIHEFTVNTNRCLPKPMAPSGLGSIVPILLIYACAFVFVFTEFYFASFKPRIINYFYPSSESKFYGTNQVEMGSMSVLIKNKK